MTEQEKNIIAMIHKNDLSGLKQFIAVNKIVDPFNFVVSQDSPLSLAKSDEMLQWILQEFNFDNLPRYMEDNINVNPALNTRFNTSSIIAILKKVVDLLVQKKSIQLLTNYFFMNRLIQKLPQKECRDSNDSDLFDTLHLFFSHINPEGKDNYWHSLEETFYKRYFAVLQFELNIEKIKVLLNESLNANLVKLGFSFFTNKTFNPSAIVINSAIYKHYDNALYALEQSDESSDFQISDNAVSNPDDSSESSEEVYVDTELEDYALRKYIIEELQGTKISGFAAERERQLNVPFFLINDIFLINNNELKKVSVTSLLIKNIYFKSIEDSVTNLSLRSLLSYYFKKPQKNNIPTIKPKHEHNIRDDHEDLLFAHSYFILIHFFLFSESQRNIFYSTTNMQNSEFFISAVKALQKNSFFDLQDYMAHLNPGSPITDLLKRIDKMTPGIFMERRNEYIKMLEKMIASPTIENSKKQLATTISSLMKEPYNYSVIDLRLGNNNHNNFAPRFHPYYR